MSTAVSQTWYMTQRQLMVFVRQPAWALITLIQPAIWLFLFGGLFKEVVELGGFGTTSYLDYLVPGVVVMSALSSNMWAGMGTLDEIQRGTLDRFLTTPVCRAALMNGNVVNNGLVTALQSVLIVLLGLLGGADYPGGIAGSASWWSPRVLLGTVFGALSNAFGMLVRERESIIGDQHLPAAAADLPVQRLHGARRRCPPGCGTSPTSTRSNWAMVAGRSALSADPDWGVGARPRGVRCWGWRWWRCGCRSGRSGRTSGRCEGRARSEAAAPVEGAAASAGPALTAAGAAPSCSASIRAFHSRLEACQPSSLWPRRQ